MITSQMSCNGGMDNVLQKGSKWHCLGGACEFPPFAVQYHQFIYYDGMDSSCEYMDDCEWREMKANEAATRFEKRKAVKTGLSIS